VFKRPLEILNATALSALGFLTVAAASSGGLSGWPGHLARVAALAAGFGLLAALTRREERLTMAGQVLVNFYPMAIIPLIYENLGPLIPVLRGREFDSALVAADRAIFGVDPLLVFARFVHPLLTDILYLAYISYYFFPIVVGVVVWRKNRELARRFIFGLTFAFYLSYAGYLAVPARGPRVALAAEAPVLLETTPVSRAISTTLNNLENTKDDAFPSGHTMITVYCLLIAFREKRGLFWAWLPIALLLVTSTIYCRFHYVVDVIAGLVLAFLAVPLGDWLYARLLGRQTARS
jgi:membrane-associated phospholipid phosphatase